MGLVGHRLQAALLHTSHANAGAELDRVSAWLRTPFEHFNLTLNVRNDQIRSVEISVQLTNLNHLPDTHPKLILHSLPPHQFLKNEKKEEILLLQTFSGTDPFCSLNDFKRALPQGSVWS